MAPRRKSTERESADLPKRIEAAWMHTAEIERIFATLTDPKVEGDGPPPALRFVGGCVRDALLHRPVHKDIDLATTATPEVVIERLERAGLKVVPTGIAHGTVTAIVDGKPFEITTLRRDVETDGRHAVVAFTTDWREDAERRDFTMNALSAEQDGTVHDFVGGRADALAGIVRFVGDPETRIREDVLRLLRFYRFYAHYGAAPADPAARAACRRLADQLPTLSGERIQHELLRLLSAPNPTDSLAMMAEDGVFDGLLPVAVDTAAAAALIAIERALEADHTDFIGAPAIRRLAAMLTGAPDAAATVAERLKLSKTDRERLVFLAAPVGAWRRPQFPLKGVDIAAAGVAAGPDIGAILRAVERWWVDEEFAPGRDECLKQARAAISRI
jgi:poly(A) polymerase